MSDDFEKRFRQYPLDSQVFIFCVGLCGRHFISSIERASVVQRALEKIGVSTELSQGELFRDLSVRLSSELNSTTITGEAISQRRYLLEGRPPTAVLQSLRLRFEEEFISLIKHLNADDELCPLFQRIIESILESPLVEAQSAQYLKDEISLHHRTVNYTRQLTPESNIYKLGMERFEQENCLLSATLAFVSRAPCIFTERSAILLCDLLRNQTERIQYPVLKEFERILLSLPHCVLEEVLKIDFKESSTAIKAHLARVVIICTSSNTPDDLNSQMRTILEGLIDTKNQQVVEVVLSAICITLRLGAAPKPWAGRSYGFEKTTWRYFHAVRDYETVLNRIIDLNDAELTAMVADMFNRPPGLASISKRLDQSPYKLVQLALKKGYVSACSELIDPY